MDPDALPVPSQWIPRGLLDEATQLLIAELFRRSSRTAGAEHAALWLAGEDSLSAAVGIGPLAEGFIGCYEQPLDKGIISMVFASGQGLCENAIASNPSHSRRLDEHLGIVTDAMIVVPVAALGRMVGVISVVRARPQGSEETPKVFLAADLEEIEFAAACTGRLLEAAVLTSEAAG